MVTGQAKRGEPWQPLPRLPETDLPEKPFCGPSEAPLAPCFASFQLRSFSSGLPQSREKDPSAKAPEKYELFILQGIAQKN